MTVTRLQTKEIKLSKIFKEWYADDSGFNFEAEKKKAFLLAQWGVYVTAYARYRLLSCVADLGSDAIYCDTDSIKYFGEHEDYFERINKITERQTKYLCNELNLDYNYFWDLGSFESEYDGQKVDGKFMGAKRYIITTPDGQDHVTIAGLPKDALPKYCEKNGLDIYDVFHDGLLLDIDVSLKNAVVYNDRPHFDIINGVQCFEKSSVGIYPNTFTMKLQNYYLFLINNYEREVANYERRIRE